MEESFVAATNYDHASHTNTRAHKLAFTSFETRNGIAFAHFRLHFNICGAVVVADLSFSSTQFTQ